MNNKLRVFCVLTCIATPMPLVAGNDTKWTANPCYQSSSLIGTKALGYVPAVFYAAAERVAISSVPTLQEARYVACKDMEVAFGGCDDEYAIIPVYEVQKDSYKVKLRSGEQVFVNKLPHAEYTDATTQTSGVVLEGFVSVLGSPEVSSALKEGGTVMRNQKLMREFLLQTHLSSSRVKAAMMSMATSSFASKLDASVGVMYKQVGKIQNKDGAWLKVQEYVFKRNDATEEPLLSSVIREGYVLQRDAKGTLKVALQPLVCD